MSNLKSYRSCFVPLCTNTTKATPDKMFLNVTQDDKRRNKWFQAVHRDNPKSKSNFFCCEDHFDLKDDMENYIYYTTIGGKAKIKIDVVPHKLDCQPNRKRQGTTTVLRPAAEKRRRQQIIQEILNEPSENMEIGNLSEPNIDAVSAYTVENIGVDFAPSNVTPGQKVTVETQTNINHRTVAIQVNSRPKYRSVSVQCKILSIGIDESCSSIKTGSISTATSPIKPLRQKLHPNLLEDTQKSLSSSSFTNSNNSQDNYEPSENTGSSTMDSSSLQSPVKKFEILKVTNYLINDNLKAYTGVPQEWDVMLERISVISSIDITNIKLSLMKIRRQDTLERLSEQFGMSVSNASIIFNKTVPVLAHLLKKLVYMPKSSNIKKILPIPFRTSYNHQATSVGIGSSLLR
ncbi:hypothetical protein KQX54_009259 [Cotesia glomerata]|uniref:THAP-type domain-containing protein n=1 Tax=Cotesia glomerata TaxID=32391 RepID=A0AAV7ITI4_COTGL|nr:hypothetical protein KQX54_009259 [Cotesia glomerata]